MINQQLLDYVKDCLNKGAGKEQISETLIKAGWQKDDISEAIKSLTLNIVVPKIILPVASTKPLQDDHKFSELKLTNQNNEISDPLKSVAKSPHKPFKFNFKIKGKVLAIVLVLVGVSILGGGAFAYFNYYMQTPEKVMAKMLNNISTVKSVEYSGDLKIEIDENFAKIYNLHALSTDVATSNDPNGLKINFSGVADYNNINKPQGRFLVNFSSSDQTVTAANISLETLAKDSVFYLKVNSFPETGITDINSLKNQWIKFSLDSFKEQIGAAKISEIASSSSLTLDQAKKIKNIFRENKIFSVAEELARENVSGLDSFHYKLNIDKIALQKAIESSYEVVTYKKLSDSEKADLNKEIANSEISNLEIWISKIDYLPIKLAFNNKIKLANGSPVAKMNSILSFKNFNKPLVLKLPETSLDIKELIAKVTSAISADNNKGEAVATSTDVNILTPENLPNGISVASSSPVSLDSDNDGLTDEQELIYGTDKNNSDTDGDGFLDGAEVKNGYNPNGSGKLVIK